ncbi:formyltransferase family protein [Elizabethkingia anophelis]|uniref:formyltransferase family protein n=1 Tax=Elizabethkingia anophelis TaxID=1117645 RepID=UPI0037335359|nr:ankyrin repeat domain-containing protein [Elizabethkingia anophelis]
MEKLTKICIAGKNNIAIKVTEFILENYENIELCVIFNQNDDGQNGFQRSFRKYCKLKNILETNLEEIYDTEDLLFLSLEFDKIVKPHLFSSNRLFNIHFSYLPEYKGMYTSALPIFHGAFYTGVTLHKIDKGIDTGDIIERQKIFINDELTAEELYLNYIEFGSSLVINNIDRLIKGDYSSKPQSIHKSTYYSKNSIDYSKLLINLNSTAFQIQRQVNAFVFPAYQLPEIFDTKIYKVNITNEKSALRAGNIIEETKFYFKVSSIDYDLFVYKDLRDELYDIAKQGDIGRLDYFFENNYSINQRSKEGWDIAIIAAYNGRFEFLDYLIKRYNWDINTCNNNGTSLIMYIMTRASSSNDISYLSYFLEKFNLDANSYDYQQISVIDYARRYGNKEVIQLIEKFI